MSTSGPPLRGRIHCTGWSFRLQGSGSGVSGGLRPARILPIRDALIRFRIMECLLTPDPTNGRFAFQLHWCPDPNTCWAGCVAGPTFDELDRLLSLEEGDNYVTVVPDFPNENGP